ncbi:MAG: aminotransferase class I/II-fold pyridoxal phosphate-dependent enzyme [Bdellovibrionaceae bacterium]|nr:aminotransferase class I/II-fold pyridoxal phosphate-dependent enzyme [Pseudobdellovibrionaceae bacterium]
MISNRAQDLIQGTSAILQGHLLCGRNPFSSKNPDGYLNFGIAENHLMEDWTLPLVNQLNVLEPSDLQYFELPGIESLRQTACNFFEKHLNLKSLNKNNLIVMNGLTSVCEALSYSLFSEGDYLMLTTPYYSGFEFDFQKRFGVNFLKVPLKIENKFEHRIEDFIKAYDSFEDKSKIRAILLTHPHNPTGEVIANSFLVSLIQFAKERKLEIISDEIYALTNFKNNSHQSMLSLSEDYREHIHFLYGLAKDFTLAGMKVGFLYSENKLLIQAMRSLSIFYCSSSLTQRFTERLLKSDMFIKSFMKENNKRLLETKNKIIQSLPELNFYHGNSGLFFLVDFRPFLQEATPAGEKALFEKLLNLHRVFLTAGSDMGMDVPGFFRLCFSRKSELVSELILRLKKFIINENIIIK